ncbi:MAG: S-layer homology domain-containing protein [Candidatus Peregrinibacteria bacterium]
MQYDTVRSGTLIIEQKSQIEGMIGSWTLLKPDNTRETQKGSMYKDPAMPIGSYTVIATPPEGGSASIEIFENDALVSEIPQPQTTFTLPENETLKIVIEIKFTRVGTVSVTSNPLGMDFTLTGPNGLTLKGTTPAFYPSVPEGLYTARFAQLEGCAEPKPLSDRLVKDGRISLSIEIQCETAAAMRQNAIQNKTLEFVTVSLDGKSVPFTDVPISAWFAPFVYKVASTGVITGYRNAEGEATGIFGPGNFVTIAELAKIAHRLVGLDETLTRSEPENVLAQGKWFAPFIASAEENGWQIYQNTRIDPTRPATRTEVVATLLQIYDIPVLWAKGKIFSDVTRDLRFADCIETAAADGLVEGTENPAFRPAFRPDDPVNRAELAKMLSNAMEIYGVDSPSFESN